MKIIQELEKQLIDNRLMLSYEETELYEQAVESIFNEEDSTVIYSLIKGFHDKTENPEVMYSNLHGIEFFSKKLPLEEYINILLPLLKTLKEDAYEWAETFFLRLLNSEKAYEVLKKAIKLQSQEDQNFLEQLLKKLVERNPTKFEIKGRSLLEMLST